MSNFVRNILISFKPLITISVLILWGVTFLSFYSASAQPLTTPSSSSDDPLLDSTIQGVDLSVWHKDGLLAERTLVSESAHSKIQHSSAGVLAGSFGAVFWGVSSSMRSSGGLGAIARKAFPWISSQKFFKWGIWGLGAAWLGVKRWRHSEPSLDGNIVSGSSIWLPTHNTASVPSSVFQSSSSSEPTAGRSLGATESQDSSQKNQSPTPLPPDPEVMFPMLDRSDHLEKYIKVLVSQNPVLKKTHLLDLARIHQSLDLKKLFMSLDHVKVKRKKYIDIGRWDLSRYDNFIGSQIENTRELHLLWTLVLGWGTESRRDLSLFYGIDEDSVDAITNDIIQKLSSYRGRTSKLFQSPQLTHRTPLPQLIEFALAMPLGELHARMNQITIKKGSTSLTHDDLARFTPHHLKKLIAYLKKPRRQHIFLAKVLNLQEISVARLKALYPELRPLEEVHHIITNKIQDYIFEEFYELPGSARFNRIYLSLIENYRELTSSEVRVMVKEKVLARTPGGVERYRMLVTSEDLRELIDAFILELRGLPLEQVVYLALVLHLESNMDVRKFSQLINASEKNLISVEEIIAIRKSLIHKNFKFLLSKGVLKKNPKLSQENKDMTTPHSLLSASNEQVETSDETLDDKLALDVENSKVSSLETGVSVKKEEPDYKKSTVKPFSMLKGLFEGLSYKDIIKMLKESPSFKSYRGAGQNSKRFSRLSLIALDGLIVSLSQELRVDQDLVEHIFFSLFLELDQAQLSHIQKMYPEISAIKVEEVFKALQMGIFKIVSPQKTPSVLKILEQEYRKLSYGDVMKRLRQSGVLPADYLSREDDNQRFSLFFSTIKKDLKFYIYYHDFLGLKAQGIKVHTQANDMDKNYIVTRQKLIDAFRSNFLGQEILPHFTPEVLKYQTLLMRYHQLEHSKIIDHLKKSNYLLSKYKDWPHTYIDKLTPQDLNMLLKQTLGPRRSTAVKHHLFYSLFLGLDRADLSWIDAIHDFVAPSKIRSILDDLHKNFLKILDSYIPKVGALDQYHAVYRSLSFSEIAKKLKSINLLPHDFKSDEKYIANYNKFYDSLQGDIEYILFYHSFMSFPVSGELELEDIKDPYPNHLDQLKFFILKNHELVNRFYSIVHGINRNSEAPTTLPGGIATYEILDNVYQSLSDEQAMDRIRKSLIKSGKDLKYLKDVENNFSIKSFNEVINYKYESDKDILRLRRHIFYSLVLQLDSLFNPFRKPTEPTMAHSWMDPMEWLHVMHPNIRSTDVIVDHMKDIWKDIFVRMYGVTLPMDDLANIIIKKRENIKKTRDQKSKKNELQILSLINHGDSMSAEDMFASFKKSKYFLKINHNTINHTVSSDVYIRAIEKYWKSLRSNLRRHIFLGLFLDLDSSDEESIAKQHNKEIGYIKKTTAMMFSSFKRNIKIINLGKKKNIDLASPPKVEHTTPPPTHSVSPQKVNLVCLSLSQLEVLAKKMNPGEMLEALRSSAYHKKLAHPNNEIPLSTASEFAIENYAARLKSDVRRHIFLGLFLGLDSSTEKSIAQIYDKSPENIAKAVSDMKLSFKGTLHAAQRIRKHSAVRSSYNTHAQQVIGTEKKKVVGFSHRESPTSLVGDLTEGKKATASELHLEKLKANLLRLNEGDFLGIVKYFKFNKTLWYSMKPHNLIDYINNNLTKVEQHLYLALLLRSSGVSIHNVSHFYHKNPSWFFKESKKLHALSQNLQPQDIMSLPDDVPSLLVFLQNVWAKYSKEQISEVMERYFISDKDQEMLLETLESLRKRYDRDGNHLEQALLLRELLAWGHPLEKWEGIFEAKKSTLHSVNLKVKNKLYSILDEFFERSFKRLDDLKSYQKASIKRISSTELRLRSYNPFTSEVNKVETLEMRIHNFARRHSLSLESLPIVLLQFAFISPMTTSWDSTWYSVLPHFPGLYESYGVNKKEAMQVLKSVLVKWSEDLLSEGLLSEILSEVLSECVDKERWLSKENMANETSSRVIAIKCFSEVSRVVVESFNLSEKYFEAQSFIIILFLIGILPPSEQIIIRILDKPYVEELSEAEIKYFWEKSHIVIKSILKDTLQNSSLDSDDS